MLKMDPTNGAKYMETGSEIVLNKKHILNNSASVVGGQAVRPPKENFPERGIFGNDAESY